MDRRLVVFRSPHTSTSDLGSRTVAHGLPHTLVHERPLPRCTRTPGNGRVAILSDSILKKQTSQELYFSLAYLGQR